MCFVWIWVQTAIVSLYSINWLVFIAETECVYCAVRIEYIYFISIFHVKTVEVYKQLLWYWVHNFSPHSLGEGLRFRQAKLVYSIQSFQADSHVKVWNFSNVSGTDSIPYIQGAT